MKIAELVAHLLCLPQDAEIEMRVSPMQRTGYPTQPLNEQGVTLEATPTHHCIRLETKHFGVRLRAMAENL